MYKKILIIVILLLLAGNIYFYLKSKNNLSESEVKAVNTRNNSAFASAAGSYKYAVAAYDMPEEMSKV